ncbi:cell division protein ZapE [Promicromonospora thailandica]|uniref:Cell division protein ZapE n=1 Tax=Promicromonospora thailandica TaxID=765201 RepID=A0A9X2G7W1_9MICO|nr:cell division protein ZapE [Promicromonospora thailandica]MCP2263541.1 cell division protein ZapE [Promicromonospora thailandica]BFF19275.1 cell division protein ZapE [Promicromonospora thailandica]
MQPSPIRDAARGAGYVLDDAQRAAADRLEDVLRGTAPRSGVYLWGPVGRGKTWLLDRFHDAAGGPRFHFHEFYRALHAEVWARTGTADAMDRALDTLLGDASVLCFDELHLHDAGDATLLSRALRVLLARGVTLVATSNYPPQGLLPDPLFHELAEPLIAALETALEVVPVDGPVDYRTRRPAADGGSLGGGWRSGAVVPATDGEPAPPAPHEAVDVPLRGGRSIRALHATDDAVWFDFLGLCAAPVSALDVLGLAERFDRWVVSDLVPFADCHVNTQQRFVHLVDVLYDRDQPLVVTTPGPLDDVLAVPADRPAPPDLARAVSRLRQLGTGRAATAGRAAR